MNAPQKKKRDRGLEFRQEVINMHRRKEMEEKNTEVLTPAQERQLMAKIAIKSPWFDVVIGVVIVLNAITISVEQALEIEEQSTVAIKVIETLFLGIYVIEFGLRWFVWGRVCLKDHWVKFDALLIVQGILFTLIIEPTSDADTQVGPLMLLRMVRLMRLGKTARIFARIQSFWMLIRGLMHSASIVAYSFVILFLLLWMASTVGVELITKNSLATSDAEFRAQVQQYFSNLPQTMLTLLQFIFVDDAHQVYRPLIEKDAWLVFYFVGVLVLFAMVLTNLISAVFFASMIDQNAREQDEVKKDQEQNWSELIADLKAMFLRLDEDQSGVLTRDEVVNMTEDDQIVLKEALGVHSAVDIFNMLDVSGSGRVSLNEFFDSIVDTILSRGSVDLKRMERQVETMHWRLKEIFVAVHDLQRGITQDTKEVHTCVQNLRRTVIEASSPIPTAAVSPAHFLGALDKTAPAPEWALDLSKTLKTVWEGTIKMATEGHFERSSSHKSTAAWEAKLDKVCDKVLSADAKSLPSPARNPATGAPVRSSPSRRGSGTSEVDAPRGSTKDSTQSRQGSKVQGKRTTSREREQAPNGLSSSPESSGVGSPPNVGSAAQKKRVMNGGPVAAVPSPGSEPTADKLRSSGDASYSTGAPEHNDSAECSTGGTLQPDIEMSTPDEIPEQPGVQATRGTHWGWGAA